MRYRTAQQVSNFLQDLTIKDAFMFAAVMSDEEQCRHLLELVLDTKILSVNVATEKKILFTKEKTRCKTSQYRFYSGFIIMTETSNPLPVLPAV